MAMEYLGITDVQTISSINYFEIAIPNTFLITSMENLELVTGFAFEITDIVEVQDLLAVSVIHGSLMRICKDCLEMIIFGSAVVDVQGVRTMGKDYLDRTGQQKITHSNSTTKIAINSLKIVGIKDCWVRVSVTSVPLDVTLYKANIDFIVVIVDVVVTYSGKDGLGVVIIIRFLPIP